VANGTGRAAGVWRLASGVWRLVAGGWWLVAGGWWLASLVGGLWVASSQGWLSPDRGLLDHWNIAKLEDCRNGGLEGWSVASYRHLSASTLHCELRELIEVGSDATLERQPSQ
jgi:hypothetical protein